jgi:YNFM family putative membrane transporter
VNTPRYWVASFALLLGGFATFASLYDVQPLLPAFARDFGVTPATASLALSATTVALAVALFVAGAISETLGRKVPMVASLVVSSAITFLCAAAPNFATLLGLRLLEGIAISGVPAIAMAYISEEVAPEALGFSMGLYLAGTALGGMSGRFVVGFVADAGGWRAALVAIGALGVVCTVAVALLLPASRNFTPQPQSPREHAVSYRAHIGDAALPWLYVTSFLIMGAFVTLYNYVGFRLAAPPFGLRQSAIGAIFAVYLVGSAASALMGRLADRYGRRNMLWLCELIFLAGVLITLAGDLPTIVAGITIFTFGFFGAHSVASSWVGRRATRDRAHAAALYLFAYYLGSSVLGSLGGIVFGAGGWTATVAAVALVLVLALVIAVVVLRVVTPAPAKATPG